MGNLLTINWTPVIPGELQDTKVGWRWFASEKAFFNPYTDPTTLDVLTANEVETLNYNTAIYTYLPVSVFFNVAMCIIWALNGIIFKVVTQVGGGFDYYAWLRRHN